MSRRCRPVTVTRSWLRPTYGPVSQPLSQFRIFTSVASPSFLVVSAAWIVTSFVFSAAACAGFELSCFGWFFDDGFDGAFPGWGFGWSCPSALSPPIVRQQARRNVQQHTRRSEYLVPKNDSPF